MAWNCTFAEHLEVASHWERGLVSWSATPNAIFPSPSPWLVVQYHLSIAAPWWSSTAAGTLAALVQEQTRPLYMSGTVMLSHLHFLVSTPSHLDSPPSYAIDRSGFCENNNTNNTNSEPPPTSIVVPRAYLQAPGGRHDCRVCRPRHGSDGEVHLTDVENTALWANGRSASCLVRFD